MQRSDETGPGWVAWTGSALVLASALVLSFTTLADLAERAGYTDWRKWLFPVCIDAAVAVAVRFWLAPGLARSAQRFGMALAMAMVALSIGGNALEHHLAGGGLLPAVLGAIPPLVLAAVGLLIDLAMRRQVDASVDTPAVASTEEPHQADASQDVAPAIHPPHAQRPLEARLIQLDLVHPHEVPASVRPPLVRQVASSLPPAAAALGRELIAASERTGRRIGRGALADQLGITTHQARQLLADYDANPPAPAAGDNHTEETVDAP